MPSPIAGVGAIVAVMRGRLFFHIVWTTRRRVRILDAPAALFLERYLRAVARQERARVLALGVVASHVHVLVETHAMTSIPRLVQRFKGGSSVLINREGHLAHAAKTLRWAKGYAVHTVGRPGLDAARAYVRSQGDRHPEERIVFADDRARPPDRDGDGPP
jgi:REP element-mobilizing transposase RayT